MRIKSYKKINNKYKINFFDGDSIDTYEDVIVNSNILFKKDLSIDDVEYIKTQNIYYDVYYKTLSFIKKMHSEYEVKCFIDSFDVSDSIKSSIFSKFKDLKLIDDSVYVKAYIHDKFFLSNDGPNKIKKNLLSNGVDSYIIDDELLKLNHDDIISKLNKLVLKKMNVNVKCSSSVFKKKILNYFVNLGYDFLDINCILDSCVIDSGDALKKEYDKLYNKLKNKYNDNELEYKIRQKLFQKGFNVDEINNLFN